MKLNNNNANDGIRMFAKAGITGAVVINSGALIATLSQFSQIIEHIDLSSIRCAFVQWAIGVSIGTLAWVCATAAASAHANHKRSMETVSAWVALVLTVGAVAMFLGGAWVLAGGMTTANAISGGQ